MTPKQSCYSRKGPVTVTSSSRRYFPDSFTWNVSPRISPEYRGNNTHDGIDTHLGSGHLNSNAIITGVHLDLHQACICVNDRDSGERGARGADEGLVQNELSWNIAFEPFSNFEQNSILYGRRARESKRKFIMFGLLTNLGCGALGVQTMQNHFKNGTSPWRRREGR